MTPLATRTWGDLEGGHLHTSPGVRARLRQTDRKAHTPHCCETSGGAVESSLVLLQDIHAYTEDA